MIILILFLGLLLRLVNINQSFWLDEAITATIARYLTLSQIWNEYLPLDNSPPLFVLLINTLFSVFPQNEFFARLPSIIAGLGTIFFTYLIGKHLKGEKFGRLSALFLSTSALHVYYSQEARMYAIGAFLAAVLVWFFLKYSEKQKIIFLSGYVVSGFLILMTHYVATLMLIFIFALSLIMKKVTRAWFFAQIVIASSFLPFLPTFFKQLKLGIEGRGVSQTFDQILGKFDFKMLPLTFEKFVLGRIPIDFNWTLALILPALALFGMLLVLGLLYSERKMKKVFGLWFLGPMLLATIISIKIPVFLYFRVLFVLPAFYFLISLGLDHFKGLTKRVVIGLVLLINITSLSLYYFDPNLQREQWRQATEWVNQEASDNDIILFASGEPFAPYLWYSKKQQAKGAFEGFYVQEKDKEKTNELTLGKQKIYQFTYLQDITDPQKKLQAWIADYNFKQTQAESFIGVGQILIYEPR